jgi:hypothetical protein
MVDNEGPKFWTDLSTLLFSGGGNYARFMLKTRCTFFNVMRKTAIVMLETSGATLQNLATGGQGNWNLGQDTPLRLTLRHTA